MTSNVYIWRILLSMFLPGALLLPCAGAASAALVQCGDKTDDNERLKCYDAAHGGTLAAPAPRSHLTRTWDLDSRDDELLGEGQSPLRPHRISYLIVRGTSAANTQPYSPTQPAAASPLDINVTELKFQFSQKAKVFNPVHINFLGFTRFRLWAAYTQQSNWQAFNAGKSSPFRETNYEPELMLTFSTGNPYGLKLVNLGYVHQSNGRDLSGSRSWNRTYVQAGWETDTLTLMLRGWWRIPETEDDNPDITEYVGRAEATLRWEPVDRSQVVDLTLRNNLRSGENRGFVQVDWATPVTVSKSTKLHVQYTSGYGESLIDYNFYQTTLGLGVSFRDW